MKLRLNGSITVTNSLFPDQNFFTYLQPWTEVGPHGALGRLVIKIVFATDGEIATIPNLYLEAHFAKD